MKPTESPPIRPIRSYVLREGRQTSGQQRALEQLWPRFGREFIPGNPLNPQDFFDREQPLRLEIGFGNGDALIYLATMHPHCNFLGVEVHRPGVGRLLLGLERERLNNVRVLRHDAAEVLAALPTACLEGIYLFFPDPWPKTRHHKRRLVQPELVARLARVLRSGGFLHLATDWENYAHWMHEVLSACPDLLNGDPGSGFIQSLPSDRPLTHFEQRGQRLGHRVWDLLFYRRPIP